MEIAHEPERGFAFAEFEARTVRAQIAMARDGLAGLLLTTEAEFRYFSGFLSPFWQSPTRPWFLFVPVEGKPVAVVPEIGREPLERTWLDDVRTWPAPNPADDGISLLLDLLAPLAARGASLGVPMGHETHLRMPLGDWQRLFARLPGLAVADAGPLVQRLRMVKSTAEIAKIAHICAIASRTFARLPDFAGEGVPLAAVFREFRRAALAQGADEVPYLVGAAGPDGYGDIISPPTDRPLARGDVMMVDTGCTWDGYHCDFDRNFAVGHASDTARGAYAQLWQATEAGIAAARPGATARGVFEAMAAELGAAGAVGRLGHGLGMQLTEQPSLAAFDETVLEEGMVLTLEPSLLYGDGLSMVHEENVVLRADGAELLSERAPEEIAVI